MLKYLEFLSILGIYWEGKISDESYDCQYLRTKKMDKCGKYL
jgi:hypothetical protein